MQAFVILLKRIVRDQEGQDMVEYALLLGLISIVAVAALIIAGQEILSIWNAVVAALPNL
jgi:pilus assembly protein Flp/PilA